MSWRRLFIGLLLFLALVGVAVFGFDSWARSRLDTMKKMESRLADSLSETPVKRAPLEPEASDGNAAADYLASEDRFIPATLSGRNALRQYLRSDPGPIPDEIRDHYEHQRTTIYRIGDGARRPSCEWPDGIKQPIETEVVEGLALCLTLRGRELEEIGRFRDAAEIYIEVMRYGHDRARQGGLTPFIVGLAAAESGWLALRRLLRDAFLREVDLRAVLGLLNRLRVPALGRVLTGERLLAYRSLTTAVDDWAGAGLGTPPLQARFGVGRRHLLAGVFEELEAFFERFGSAPCRGAERWEGSRWARVVLPPEDIQRACRWARVAQQRLDLLRLVCVVRIHRVQGGPPVSSYDDLAGGRAADLLQPGWDEAFRFQAEEEGRLLLRLRESGGEGDGPFSVAATILTRTRTE